MLVLLHFLRPGVVATRQSALARRGRVVTTDRYAVGMRFLRSRPRCDSPAAHDAHDACVGLAHRPCEMTDWHGPHRLGPGIACPGVGLAGICPHGEQMLNECKQCEAQSACDASQS